MFARAVEGKDIRTHTITQCYVKEKKKQFESKIGD